MSLCSSHDILSHEWFRGPAPEAKLRNTIGYCVRVRPSEPCRRKMVGRPLVLLMREMAWMRARARR
jgi:hypothetical protein